MTETQLAEAVATLLRAVSTAPLSTLEVHVQDQVGYEDPDGSVTVFIIGGNEEPEAIGEQFADEVNLRIVGMIPWADTLANRQGIETLCKQIRTILRGDNRRLSAGGELATRNTNVAWEYGFTAEGADAKRTCSVTVTYRIRQS